ncbi:phenylacetate--CoA ligase family protein [Coraliomargarita parva]|uniref:phenylacetate--CoA ligase family protein n=1 Tax=Coraliomargarita parva TaxID=3014050 RepID=UPI0022B35376|nr:AMP-binding protein [Coraliomargarita parva]
MQAHAQTWWEKASTDEIRHQQSRLLRRYLKLRVIPFVRHYREIFQNNGIRVQDIRTTDDLERLPFTRKEDFENNRDFVVLPEERTLKLQRSSIGLLLRYGPKRAKRLLEREFRPIFLTSTTGRSSRPVPFLYSAYDLDRLQIAGTRLMQICGSRPEYKHVNAFPYAPHLAFWQAHYAGLGFGSFTLSSGGGKTIGTEGNIRFIEKTQADALIGMPTFIYHLMHIAVDEGMHWPHLKTLVLGGEKVPDGMRRKLRKLCAQLDAHPVRILSTYGFTEAKMAWTECGGGHGEENHGFHLYPDMGYMEVIDPESGRRVPEGEPGEIVYTQLDCRGTTVLRYRTGDLVEGGLSYEACPGCGRRCPRLVGRISRVSNIHQLQLDKLKGSLVDFNNLEHLLDDTPSVGAWQLEIRKHNDDPLDVDEIIVHVVPIQDTISHNEMEHTIRERFKKQVEVMPNSVQVHDWDAMRKLQGVGRELKERKVIDHRPQKG